MPGGTVNVIRGNGFERRSYSISWAPAGASTDPNLIRDRGDVVLSLVRTGTGTFRVIFRAGVVTERTYQASLATIRTNYFPALRAYSSNSQDNADGTWQILVQIVDPAGAAADLPGGAQREVSLIVETDEMAT